MRIQTFMNLKCVRLLLNTFEQLKSLNKSLVPFFHMYDQGNFDYGV